MKNEARTSTGSISRVYVDRRTRDAGYLMSHHHCHPYYELSYIEHGSCRFFVEDAIYDLHDGDFLLIPPQLFHYTRYLFGSCLRCGVYFRAEDLSPELIARIPGGIAFFSQMRPGASFFNASRGEVVDEDALLAARPRLDKLVLDVWKNEPAINRALLAVADIATPHIAGYSIQGKINGTQAIVRAVGETFGIDPLRQFSVTGVSLPQEPYDIFRDDASLRRDPSAFESLRSHYAYRNDQLKTLS